jgi:hypothetical protein
MKVNDSEEIQCSFLGVPLHYKHQGTNPEFMGHVWDARVPL